MDYLPLFLLFLAALIAAWFYLQRAKARDAGKATAEPVHAEPTQSEPTQSEPTHAETNTEVPAARDRVK